MLGKPINHQQRRGDHIGPILRPRIGDFAEIENPVNQPRQYTTVPVRD